MGQTPVVPTVLYIRRARDVMDARYAEPLVIDDLAAAAGCSRYHFIRLFTQAYGETPGAYLARRRIERAKDLLRSANLTVTEICMLVGYASLGTFSRRFTEIVGMSPSTYRARARRDGPPPIPGCFVFAWSRPNGKIDKPGKTAITEKPTGSLAD